MKMAEPTTASALKRMSVSSAVSATAVRPSGSGITIQKIAAAIDKTPKSAVTGQKPGPRFTDFGRTVCAKNYLTCPSAAKCAPRGFLRTGPPQLLRRFCSPGCGGDKCLHQNIDIGNRGAHHHGVGARFERRADGGRRRHTAFADGKGAGAADRTHQI